MPDLLSLARQFFEAIPHTAVLGAEVIAAEPGQVTARMPYKPELVGNPETGQMHGGVIITLVDQTSAAAAVCAMDDPEPVATLDLRVDHMQPAEPGREVYARGECYRITRNILFVRCVVYQDSPERPVAASMSTFMRSSTAAYRKEPDRG